METAALIIRVWEVEKPGQCGFMKDQDDRSRCEVDALDNGMQDAALFFQWAIRQLSAQAGRPGLQPGQCGNARFLRAHEVHLENNRQTLTKCRCLAGVRVARVVNSFLLLAGVGEGYAAGEALNFGDGAKGCHAGT